jgi:hypothetical protein
VSEEVVVEWWTTNNVEGKKSGCVGDYDLYGRRAGEGNYFAVLQLRI